MGAELDAKRTKKSLKLNVPHFGLSAQRRYGPCEWQVEDVGVRMKDVGVEDLKGGEDGRTLHPALQEVDDHQGDQVAGHGQVARLVDALSPGNQT